MRLLQNEKKYDAEGQPSRVLVSATESHEFKELQPKGEPKHDLENHRIFHMDANKIIGHAGFILMA